MPSLPMDFEVFCGKCGAGLCSNCTEGRSRGRGMPYISVTPCETCLGSANERGFEDGHAKGWDEAKQDQQEVVH